MRPPRPACRQVAAALVCTALLGTGPSAAAGAQDAPAPPEHAAAEADPAADGSAPADAAPADAALPRLVAVRFTGNDAAAAEALERQLLTDRPPPWWRPWAEPVRFSPGSADEEARRLVRWYRTIGHFEARVRPEIVWREADAVELVFHIEEGPVVRLVERGIEIPASLTAGRPPDVFVEDLPIAVGDPFTLERYESAKTELLARLAEAGHPLAEVTGGADVYVQSREARITWRVEPGPLVRFGEVSVEGLEDIDPRLVEREITIKPGAPYSLEEMRKTRRAIQDLRIFGSVIVSPDPEEAQAGAPGEVIWPIEVRVVERKRRSIEVGVGYGTEDKLRGEIGYIHRNFLGGARRFEARARYSSLVRSFGIELQQPRFLGPRRTLHLETRLGQELTPAYDAERLMGAIGVEQRIGPHWRVRSAWKASWSAIGDAGGSADRLLDDPEGRVLMSGLGFGVRRSTVADPLDARDGSWLDLEVTPWLPVLGSDVAVVEGRVEGRIYRPLGPTVVAGRLRLGTLQPFAGDSEADIPLTHRFYAGGGNSVRGYSYWELGPRAADGDPVGGASLLEGSLELRFPIWKALGGVAFVDAGQLDLDAWGWDPADLSYSVGFGLRYHTPLGPIRLDLAWPIDPPDASGTTFFHFSIGQAF